MRDGISSMPRSSIACFMTMPSIPPWVGGSWASLQSSASRLRCYGRGPDPTGHYVLAGRLAPAIAFATLVSLVTLVAGRRWGLAAGAAAELALVAMPRVFAHAHLAALDTFLSLFWNLALIASDRVLHSKRPVAAMAAAGEVWALALLTKIHGWFLLPILAAWACVLLPPRRRARGNLGLGDGRNLLVRSLLALALVRFLASTGRLLGHGLTVVDHGPVLRPGRRRS